MAIRNGLSSRALAVFELSAAVLSAQRPSTVASALGRLLKEVGVSYYVVEASGPNARRRRLVPRRCSVLASAVLSTWRDLEEGRSGAWRPSPDTLVVRVHAPGGAPGYLVCAVGLAPALRSDARFTRLLGGVVKGALARVLALEAEQRRQWLLETLCGASGDLLFLYASSGRRIACLPDAAGEPFLRGMDLLRQAAAGAGDRSGADRVLSIGATDYTLRHRWLDSPVRGDGRVQLVEARRRSRVPQALQDRIGHSGLTRRELQVATLISNGHTNRAIADSLCVSPNTVKTHCRHIFEKLGIARRMEFLQLFRQEEPQPPACS